LKADWFAKAPVIPRNYKVADFGVDADVLATQKSIKGAEKVKGHTMTANFGQKDRGYPINYSVPSFGADPEITASQLNLAKVERDMGHRIKLRTNKEVMDEWGMIRYETRAVPDFGVDSDILST
jgi:hypothetical protein